MFLGEGLGATVSGQNPFWESERVIALFINSPSTRSHWKFVVKGQNILQSTAKTLLSMLSKRYHSTPSPPTLQQGMFVKH